MERAMLFAVVMGFLLFAGCMSSSAGGEQKSVELKMYDFRVKPLAEGAIPAFLWEKYRSAPVVDSVVFNGYRVSYSVLHSGYEFRAPDGTVYTAKIYKREGNRLTSIKKARILVLRMEFQKVGERGIEPPEVTQSSPLASLLLFGGLAPVERKVVLTGISTYLGLGDSYVAQWNFAPGYETRNLCTFDTSSSPEKGYGICLFTYPEDKKPSEIIVSLTGVRDPGYVIARIPIHVT